MNTNQMTVEEFTEFYRVNPSLVQPAIERLNRAAINRANGLSTAEQNEMDGINEIIIEWLN